MTAKDLSPKNDYYRYFLSRLWFKIGSKEDLLEVLDNGIKADIPEFDYAFGYDVDFYKSLPNPRSALIKDLLWMDLQLWHPKEKSLREWITWNKDGTTTHEWEDGCAQGPADLAWFLGIQSQCVYDNCTIRIYLGDPENGLLCIIYRTNLKIEFCQFITDDGCYCFTQSSKWPQETFIQFKVALMSEIAELKIPGLDHQLILEELFNMTEFNFTNEYY